MGTKVVQVHLVKEPVYFCLIKLLLLWFYPLYAARITFGMGQPYNCWMNESLRLCQWRVSVIQVIIFSEVLFSSKLSCFFLEEEEKSDEKQNLFFFFLLKEQIQLPFEEKSAFEIPKALFCFLWSPFLKMYNPSFVFFTAVLKVMLRLSSGR